MEEATRRNRLLWGALVFALGLGGAWLLIVTTPRLETAPQGDVRRTVRVVGVEPRTVQLVVRSQGTVVPRVQSELVPEISGRVVWVAPALAAGGYFQTDDPLVRIDAADYQAALRRAQASVIRTQAEHANARHDLERRESLAGSSVVSEEQLEDARRAERVSFANLEEAHVTEEEAGRNLARTELRAPFVGRVRDERVDVGQFVERGNSIGTLYAIDTAEVRLPVPDRELVFLDWPSPTAASPTGAIAPGTGPEVTLRATFGGATRSWGGRVVRTDGSIDPRTRMVHVIAQVEDPYGIEADGNGVPLTVGLFVQAEILGRSEENVVVLPRSALHSEKSVLVVDEAGRLKERPVVLLRTAGQEILVSSGLSAGERVCVSDVALFVEGMEVEAVPAVPAGPAK
ncbi:MAG: efflux RND transporter periplasmic adaptor subunit [Deltaproteobacteria bacterium]|nr:efflux RND transporter periplasmic adaptor subunit [Deltaproteobacteria bacterium]